MKALLVILLLGAGLGNSPVKGLSAFAALNPRFPCAQYLRLAAKADAPAMAVLHGYFGNSYTCVHRFVNQMRFKPHVVEVHLAYEKPRPTIKARAAVKRRVRDILNRLPPRNINTRFVLSVGLEDRLTTRNAQKRVQWVRDVWPYEVARNPEQGTNKAGADLLEQHRLKGKCAGDRIMNNDGVALSKRKAQEYARRFDKCAMLYLWTPELQDCCGPVDQRKFKITATDRKIWETFLRG